jgi:hypothetical protein
MLILFPEREEGTGQLVGGGTVPLPHTVASFRWQEEAEAHQESTVVQVWIPAIAYLSI